MTIGEHHPQWQAMTPDWHLMRVSKAGQRAVKAAGVDFLPATDGMVKLGMARPESRGSRMYEAYKCRAVFPELVRETLRKMVGFLNLGPAQVELPARLEPLRKRATVEGESLQLLIERIHEELLLIGRIGLLGDIPSDAPPTAMPFLLTYSAERIANWDDGKREDGIQRLHLVVLNESEYERDPGQFTWTYQNKYRVLALGPIGDLPDLTYGTQLLRGEQAFSFPQSFDVPSLGGRSLDAIPFTFINCNDLVPAPDMPPLLALANIAMTMYRGSADYRQALFMQGQETLAIIGSSAPTETGAEPTIGAGGIIYIEDPEGDAKYVGVSAAGLGEMRQALDNDKRDAAELGAQILERTTNEAEARDTLQMRVASRTTSFVSIARSAAAGVEDTLKRLAVWTGADPDQVSVQPNLDFIQNETFAGRDALEWAQAKAMGFPVSWMTMHGIMRDRNVSKLSFEEETDAIENEADQLGGLGVPGAPPAISSQPAPTGEETQPS